MEPPLASEASAAAAAVVLPRYCDLPEFPMASPAKGKHVAVPLDPARSVVEADDVAAADAADVAVVGVAVVDVDGADVVVIAGVGVVVVGGGVVVCIVSLSFIQI